MFILRLFKTEIFRVCVPGKDQQVAGRVTDNVRQHCGDRQYKTNFVWK